MPIREYVLYSGLKKMLGTIQKRFHITQAQYVSMECKFLILLIELI